MTTIYLDTSAFLRSFVIGSTDQVAALALLNTQDFTLVSSELLWLETDRFLIRAAHENPATVNLRPDIIRGLQRITQVVLDRSVLTAARAIPESIKSMDAIHVATAESLGSALDYFVTYDKTMTTVLQAHGIQVTTASQALAR